MSKTLYVDKIKPQSLTVGELATVTLDLDEMVNVPSASPAGFYLRLGDGSTTGGLKLLIAKAQIVGLSLIASEINIDPDITPYGSTKTVHQALSTLATNLSVSGTLVSMDDTSAGSTTKLWSSSKIASELSALGSEIATSILPPVADVSTLKAIDTTSLADKVLIFVESKGLYRFDEDSTATGDDDGVVDPTTGDGRWIKMSSTSSHNAITIATGSTSYLSVNATQELSFAKNDLIFSTDAFSSTGKLVKTNSTGREIIITGVAVDSSNNLTAASFVKSGGTSAQFLKADGSVDSTSYQSALTNPITGTGTANEIAYFPTTSTVGSLATATYPSLTELSYVKGVTSAIQTQLGTKSPSASPTFTTSITGSYLTASEILITDGSKNIVSAAVATYPNLTELSYVKGVTSSIQTQLGAFTTVINASALAANNLIYWNGSKLDDITGATEGYTLVGTGATAPVWNSTLFVDRANDRVALGTTSATRQLTLTNSIALAATTGSDVGVIYKGIYSFIHDYGTSNTFMGVISGNFTTTGVNNVGVGTQTLNAMTSADYNTAFGALSLMNNTTGDHNNAIGYFSMQQNTTGVYNNAMGSNTLANNTSGGFNVAVGSGALYTNTTGYDNTAVGYNTGQGITTGYDNTIIGANVTGLSSSLVNNIILATGQGTIRSQFDGTNWIFNSGNVGIGYTDPGTYKLKVNGTGYFNGMVTATTMKLTTIGTSTMDKILGITSDGTFTTDTVVINCRGGARAA